MGCRVVLITYLRPSKGGHTVHFERGFSLVLTCILQFYSFTNNENAASLVVMLRLR
jgi:hypothetical protein